MKVGSIVECVKPSIRELAGFEIISNIKMPIVGHIYTVRETLIREGYSAILLEEIINPKLWYKPGYVEICFQSSRFRELLPPIENIEEYINKNTITRQIEPALL